MLLRVCSLAAWLHGWLPWLALLAGLLAWLIWQLVKGGSYLESVFFDLNVNRGLSWTPPSSEPHHGWMKTCLLSHRMVKKKVNEGITWEYLVFFKISMVLFGFLLFSYGSPMLCLCFPMVVFDCRWLFCGCPLVSLSFPMDFFMISYGLLWFADGFRCFPIVFLSLLLVFP